MLILLYIMTVAFYELKLDGNKITSVPLGAHGGAWSRTRRCSCAPSASARPRRGRWCEDFFQPFDVLYIRTTRDTFVKMSKVRFNLKLLQSTAEQYRCKVDYDSITGTINRDSRVPFTCECGKLIAGYLGTMYCYWILSSLTLIDWVDRISVSFYFYDDSVFFPSIEFYYEICLLTAQTEFLEYY